MTNGAGKLQHPGVSTTKPVIYKRQPQNHEWVETGRKSTDVNRRMMCFGALRSFHQFKRTESNKYEKPCRKVVITVKIGTPVMKTDIVPMTSGREESKWDWCHLPSVSSTVWSIIWFFHFFSSGLQFKITTEGLTALQKTELYTMVIIAQLPYNSLF